MSAQPYERVGWTERLRCTLGGPLGMFAVSLSLSGCSLFLPHSTTPDGPAGDTLDTAQCSLELDRSRQVAPCDQNASGAPTPLVIRLTVRSAGGSAILDRSLVSLSSDPSESSAAGPDAAWQLQKAGEPTPRPGPQRVDDGDAFYLWNVAARRYLRISASGDVAADAENLADASLVVLSKDDVTNPNRPSTCDEHVRDGDYVLLRTMEPSAWLTASNGAFHAAPLPVDGGERQPDQRCGTEVRDQLLCGWAPHCVREK